MALTGENPSSSDIPLQIKQMQETIRLQVEYRIRPFALPPEKVQKFLLGIYESATPLSDLNEVSSSLEDPDTPISRRVESLIQENKYLLFIVLELTGLELGVATTIFLG